MTAPGPPAAPAPGLPLDGITVVSLEQAVAAPYATRLLADLGARVIKVERPGGGDFARNYDSAVKGLASYFVWLNRGKESVALDLKSAAGGSALTALVGRADVFVQNLAPGAAERMGLSASALRAADPKLIVCDVSGYAPDGPMGDRRAYDLLIQCETGLLSVTGSPDAPAKAGPRGAARCSSRCRTTGSGGGCATRCSAGPQWPTTPVRDQHIAGGQPRRAARWTPRPARCARCPRRSASAAAPRPRSARSRPWASTRPPCWRSSGSPTPFLLTGGSLTGSSTPAMRPGRCDEHGDRGQEPRDRSE
jgi:hypothetical protein